MFMGNCQFYAETDLKDLKFNPNMDYLLKLGVDVVDVYELSDNLIKSLQGVST